ncbi:lyase family protein [Nocardiopsis ansamitocini]|uniref:Aspartate ammonia-lyase n=1 Tax=Nocardiopsis ansamitocini TaxID=1670832 RepID=A0A9W6P522_9ACTN|nr:lyase family protein [Nocardiopsis ansamitocini]GLU47485.1 aspartate ammonia-lyase [Nocardiopsis ansamitocini]
MRAPVAVRLPRPPAGRIAKPATAGLGRIERDRLGEGVIPGNAYWGIHTCRALGNFTISRVPVSAHPHLVNALAAVKEAAAQANRELGLLRGGRAEAIIQACQEIRSGNLHEQFVVDVVQGGSGTSTNMNANEVIANRALEILGHNRGEYQYLHPTEDVNLGQSTNEVHPTAAKIATITALGGLITALETLREAFAKKAAEFDGVRTIGRAQARNCSPMSLGQGFHAYAGMLGRDEGRLRDVARTLYEVNVGVPGIGSNAVAGYSEAVRRHLCLITGLPLTSVATVAEATQDCAAFVDLSGVLKRIAVELSKISNDLRLLSSGTRSGFNDIDLPVVQAHPGSVRGEDASVIPELVNQIAFTVVGNDAAITMAAEAGQLQFNAFEPVIVHSLAQSIAHLREASLLLARRCVAGITPSETVPSAPPQQGLHYGAPEPSGHVALFV